MNISIPFRIEKVAGSLTKVSTGSLCFHQYTLFVVLLCGKHVFVITFFDFWKLYKFFNNTILDEPTFAGTK